MKEINAIRNIGISAHIDSGKTTLTERVLYYSGKIHKIEEVRGGGDGATMDHMELEKEKGITITAAATTVYWNDNKINIIDTPGHVDFTVEVERSLRVLDGAILVLCGVAGVQSQSITVDRQMKRYNVPRLAFINKLDRVGSRPKKVVNDLCEKLKHKAVLMQLPIGLEGNFRGVVDLITMKAIYNEGEKGENVIVKDIPNELMQEAQEERNVMLDKISLFSNDLTECLLEEKEPSLDIIYETIKAGVQNLELTPVFLGTAFKNKGVQSLLDAVCRYLPSPFEAKVPVAYDLSVEEKEKIELKVEPSEAAVCLAFKITEEQFGQLTYIRIYQGTIKKGLTVYNTRTGKKLRIGRLVRMHASFKENIEVAYAGDIIAMVGVDCASGDTFCEEGVNFTMENIFVNKPVISLAITPEDSAGNDKMSKALGRFLKEDPTFHVTSDAESGETIISGMGELHLDIYIERMRREYGIPIKAGSPQVNYRESITKKTEFDYTHKKQTGGAGQFACVVGSIEPLDYNEEKNFQFKSFVKGGNIPTEFISACEKGFMDVTEKGPLAEYPVIGVKVNLMDGKYHEVDSSDMAFRICSRQAMKNAINEGNPALLEPVMNVEAETPIEYQGVVIGDLSSRRGMITGTETRDDVIVILASVPLSEMFGYATSLRSATAGKASYSMEFEKYAPCPKNIQEKIITERNKK